MFAADTNEAAPGGQSTLQDNDPWSCRGWRLCPHFAGEAVKVGRRLIYAKRWLL